MQKSSKMRANKIQHHINRITYHDLVGLIPTGIRNGRVVQHMKTDQHNTPH